MKISFGGKKKNQNLKAPATLEVTSLREEKEKNPIIPELKTYSSVYNRSPILSSVCNWINLITPLRGLAFFSSSQAMAGQI